MKVAHNLLVFCFFGCVLATIISGIIWGERHVDWNDWNSKTCLIWTKNVPDPQSPTFCNSIEYLQEPVTGTETSWHLDFCRCTECPPEKNATEIHCWYESRHVSDDGHSHIRLGSHPGTDPRDAKNAFYISLGLFLTFGVLGAISWWPCKRRRPTNSPFLLPETPESP